MPGGTEPLSEQLVMETTVLLSEGNPSLRHPGGTRGNEVDSVQGAGTGKLRKHTDGLCCHKPEQK